MRFIMFLCGFLFSATVVAETSSADPIQMNILAELKAIHIILMNSPSQPSDPIHFCYRDGKPYSEGAAVDGLVCSRPDTSWLQGDKGVTTALRWQAARKIRKMP